MDEFLKGPMEMLQEVRGLREKKDGLEKESKDIATQVMKVLNETRIFNNDYASSVRSLVGLEAFRGMHSAESSDFQLGFLHALLMFVLPEEYLKVLKHDEKSSEPEVTDYV